jgi:beta-glucosidase
MTTMAGSDHDVEAWAERILAAMTLEEKAALSVGRDSWTTMPLERLGLRSVWMSDGPTGLRKARDGKDMSVGHNVPATCFPAESALGASWDRDLAREVAGAIAREAQAEGVQVVLGPGVNLKRSPLCGRNFEYFAEDPVLAGELAAAFVTGLQEHGVGASVKHLAANECETDHMFADSVVDERALRELYLRPFEIAVEKAAPWTLMAAYNRLNGTYCAENTRLLQQIVAEEWGYRGIVVSDWFAVNDRAQRGSRRARRAPERGATGCGAPPAAGLCPAGGRGAARRRTRGYGCPSCPGAPRRRRVRSIAQE